MHLLRQASVWTCPLALIPRPMPSTAVPTIAIAPRRQPSAATPCAMARLDQPITPRRIS